MSQQHYQPASFSPAMSSQTDENTAEYRFSTQTVLIAQDVPPGTQLGIDCKAWTTGPRFMGIKMIPSGLHFVYHSAVDTMSSATLSSAPRAGFFFSAQDRKTILTRWDKENECLQQVALSQEDEQRLRDDLPNLDRFLGAYPAGDDFEKWKNLTYSISNCLVLKLEPPSKIISSATEMEGVSGIMAKRRDPESTEPEAPSRASQLKDAWKTLKPVEHMRIRFTDIPDRLFPPQCPPHEITKHSLDRTYTLKHLLTHSFKGWI